VRRAPRGLQQPVVRDWTARRICGPREALCDSSVYMPHTDYLGCPDLAAATMTHSVRGDRAKRLSIGRR
jgi:hypothetical protein